MEKILKHDQQVVNIVMASPPWTWAQGLMFPAVIQTLVCQSSSL